MRIRRLSSVVHIERIIAFSVMIAVLLLASAVRFHNLGIQSLWHDEGNSYVQATRSLPEIARNAARDIHPPGYYWSLAIWRSFTGETEFALRALSALASVITVAVTYRLGVRLFGTIAGLCAALFVALNTFSIYYAQETRMYALLALWGVASMWALAAFVWSANGHRSLVYPALALMLTNTAGLWTQYAFPFVMIAQGILFVLWWGAVFIRPQQRRRETLSVLGYYVAANLLTIALYLPWLGTAWGQVTSWPNIGEAIPLAEALATIVGYFAFGLTFEGGTTLLIAIFLLFGLLQVSNDPDDTKRPIYFMHSRWFPAWWPALLPVIWVGVTVGAFLMLGLFRDANLKFMLPAQIGFALWMARGVRVLWGLRVRRDAWVFQQVPRVAAVLGTLWVVLGLWRGLSPLYDDPAYQRDDYRAIVNLIEVQADSDDAVILNAPNQQEVFNYYYLNGETPVYPLPRGLGGDDAATWRETRQVINTAERIYAVLWGTDERDPNNIVETTLDAEAFEIDSVWYGNVRLVRYVTAFDFDDYTQSMAQFGDHITLERYALNTETITVGDVLQVQFIWSTDAALDVPYKIFLQLLDENGVLVAQRDAEPGGGLFPVTSWQPGEAITDNHALIVPNDLPPANYSLIVGFYNPNNPQERLNVELGDFLRLADIVVE